ncbi:MAG: hypothetical protein JNK60_19655 [Acidobacteria bacterium]|nr:hypothetical protein [Acidobacteriota bacterium]
MSSFVRLFVCLGLLSFVPLRAAEFVIVNRDAAGVGLNDPTPATPVGGNPGTTVGQQRLAVFEEVARIWGAALHSDVPIRINAGFAALPCDATGATLAQARQGSFQVDFPGAPLRATQYGQALANKLAGRDLDFQDDIEITISSSPGTVGCGFTWYYGLDHQEGDATDLLATLLHEAGHGLGFLTPASGSSGALWDGMSDAYLRHLYDSAAGQDWESMTDASRRASAIGGALTWLGADATRFGAGFLAGLARLRVDAPSTAAGTYTQIGTASFGPPLGADVSGALVLVNDGTAPESDGCEPITNNTSVRASIALIDRGTCAFVVKVKNAQNAGAVGVVIVNNTTGIINMSGDDPSITIPAISVTQADGLLLKAGVPGPATLGRDRDQFAGADAAGRFRMFAPNPYQRGSSVSHFDISVFPNALMEPAINSDLTSSVDATLEVFKGIGWTRPKSPSATGWILPSAARAPGAGNAFYTTDLAIANGGAASVPVTLQFLGNSRNGSTGPTRDVTVPARGVVSFTDVLSSAFGLTGNEFGAIRVTSSRSDAFLTVLGQTSTPAPGGGTFGQSVPAAEPSDLVINGSPRAIVGLREDSLFRTNLVLVNATDTSLDVEMTLVTDDGRTLGPVTVAAFLPWEMRQVSRVVRQFAEAGDVTNGMLVVSTPTVQGAFATYAAVIDNTTNDPRTLLPSVEGPSTFFLPASARAPGAGGAFYTTDLAFGNRGPRDARVKLKFLGNTKDGRDGVEKEVVVPAGKTLAVTDVLGSVFALTQDFGALRVASSNALVDVLGQTSTPGSGGTFGQSVALAGPWDLIHSNNVKTILGVREDAGFRTNLIVTNVTEANLDIDLDFRNASGAAVGARRISLRPLEMQQISRVLDGVSGAPVAIRLLTSTLNGRFAAYASVIDNVTNDPRTLLPK